MKPTQVIFINSHPIQYFAPLYKYLNDHSITAEVWYCSNENEKGHFDRQFNSNVSWDIPLLEGYSYKFFRNVSWSPSLYSGFFGLINPGIIRALFLKKKSLIVVHGWSHLTHVLTIIMARLAGHQVCLRGESPLNQEMMKSKTNRMIKRIILQGFLFKFVDKFLFIGSQNRAFYQYYGIELPQLVFVPYAVDNDRFQAAAKHMESVRNSLREKLGFRPKDKIVLFAAKYISKKRPMDILKAYKNLEVMDKCLVMAGEGELRGKMEDYIRRNNVEKVSLTGFVNQTAIEEYYAIADVFVLCSGVGETWGLSVNEAMNFGLPVVVSDIAGCGFDLVKDGDTGFISLTGDIENLTNRITSALQIEKPISPDVINIYSFDTIVKSFQSILENQHR